MKQDTIKLILDNKIITIVRGLPKDKIILSAEALYVGGIRLMEVTFNQSSKNKIQETTEAIESIYKVFGDKLCVGAGTVLSTEEAEAAFNAGAKYLISPSTNIEVIDACHKLGIVSIPGAMTPSEIVMAYNNGADFVKLFPAGIFGLDYIKAIRAPLNHIPMLAVGGIDEQNISDFMYCGLAGVGIGSNILRKDLINQGRYEEISILAKRYIEAIK